MYSVRNANVGTLKPELGARQPVWEKCCIPAPPSTPVNYDLTVTEKKCRIVKNGITPSSSDGPVMTVKSTSIEKPLKDRDRKGMRAHFQEQITAT